MRAERLQRLGILDMLHPNDLEAEAITRFLKRNIRTPPRRTQVDMNGLARVLDLVESLLTERDFATQTIRLNEQRGNWVA